MKTRIVCFVVALAILAALNSPMRAGDKGKKDDPLAGMPKPGPEHKLLAKGEGTWNADVKMWMDPTEPSKVAESKGMMTRKMIMDGRFLQEKFTGEFFGQKFHGMGILGYDVNKKKYLMTWIDNFDTSIMMNEGSYDAGKKTFTFTGEENGPKGKMKTRDVIRMVNENEQIFEMYREPVGLGKEFKVMEIRYTRAPEKTKKIE